MDLFGFFEKAENWRTIPGYPCYQVSETGKVRRVRHDKDEFGFVSTKYKVLKPKVDRHGYLRVNLSQGGQVKSEFIHKLVMISFVGPRPEGMQVLHYDDCKTNNQLSNLRYGTRAENIQDARRNGIRLGRPVMEKCLRGHDFAAENTIFEAGRNGASKRRCKTCKENYEAKRLIRRRWMKV